MMLRRLTNQRGNILLFTVVAVVPIMLIFAGLAIDMGYFGDVDAELQRAMDAAALAGAGKLGFDASAFGPARQAAQDYATRNPYRAENAVKQITTSTFTQNANNADPNGNVILGIWNGQTRTFTPWSSSADDVYVNAVKCQYASSIPTSFLKLIPGLGSLSVAAQAIAVSNPPNALCPGCCLFPIGVTKCAFQTEGNFGSQGCGQPVSTFTSATVNTAAWINTTGTGAPSARDTQNAITAAATGAACNSTLQSGGEVGAQNGMDQSVFDSLANCTGIKCKFGPGTQGYFIDKFNSGPIYTVRDSNNPPNVTYEGHGWEVFVAVIDTSCPPGPITRDHQILTFSRLVITQVIDHGYCSVQNRYPGNPWDASCPTPNGTGTFDPNLNAIFGYFSCESIDGQPAPIPAPRTALATKLKLVR